MQLPSAFHVSVGKKTACSQATQATRTKVSPSLKWHVIDTVSRAALAFIVGVGGQLS